VKRYSAERKESILRQIMPPTNKLVSAKKAEEWSSKDKFGVVLETSGLNEAELAEYCRRKGLFIEQIAAWRAACQDANEHPAERTRDQREQSKSDRKRIKQLEKELLRKEKALAEAAALIILRKKPRRSEGIPRKTDGHPGSPVGDDLD
jgi:hypothetical protein